MDKEKAGQYRKGSAKPASNGKVIKTFDGFSTEQIASVFSLYEGQIGQLISKQIRDRFVQIAITMIAKDRIIKDCTQESVLGAFLTAAMYDLEILPQLGHCYFVPYKNKYKENMKELQFQIGYQGYVILMIRGGAKDVFAQVVYQKDEFSIDWAREIPITHKPVLTGERGNLAFVWGRIHNANDIKKYDWMNEEGVHKRRAKSPSAFDKRGNVVGIWKEWTEEQWMKTLIRAMRKLVPLKTKEGPDLQNAILADGAVIPAHLLGAGGKIDLSRVTYPDQEEDDSPVVIHDTSTSQEQGVKPEDESQEELAPDQKPIEPKHLKFLIDCMKKTKIANMMDYVKNGWGVKELSVNAINVETLKGILFDLGNTLSPDDPGALIDEVFFGLKDSKNDKKEPAKEEPGATKGGQQKTPPDQPQPKTDEPEKDSKGKENPPELEPEKPPKEEKRDSNEPHYNVNEVRILFKQKTQALSELGVYTIGDLLSEEAFNVATLSITDCSYLKYLELMDYLERLPNNKIQPIKE